MNIREQFLKYSGIFVFMLIAMTYVLGIIIPSENIKVYQTQIDPCVDNWYYTDTSIPVTDSSLRIKPQKKLSITRTLEEINSTGKVLGFYDPGTHVRIYIDNRLVFEAGKDNSTHFGEETGSVWRCIPISGCSADSSLTISFENNTQSNKNINLSRMYICEENTIFRIILVYSVGNIIIFSICIVMGMMLLFLCYGFYRLRIRQYYIPLLYLSGLCVSVGLWVISEGGVLQLLFNYSSTQYGLSYAMLMLIGYFFIVYHREILHDIRPVLNYVLASYDFVLLTIIILNLLNIVNIKNSIIMVHLYMIIMVVLILIFGTKQYLRERRVDSLGTLISIIILVPAVLIGLATFNTDGNSANTSLVTGIGFVALLITSTLSFGRAIVNDLKKFNLNIKSEANSGE